jgi:hypothetical protein
VPIKIKWTKENKIKSIAGQIWEDFKFSKIENPRNVIRKWIVAFYQITSDCKQALIKKDKCKKTKPVEIITKA